MVLTGVHPSLPQVWGLFDEERRQDAYDFAEILETLFRPADGFTARVAQFRNRLPDADELDRLRHLLYDFAADPGT